MDDTAAALERELESTRVAGTTAVLVGGRATGHADPAAAVTELRRRAA
jgi:hypothetical protein